MFHGSLFEFIILSALCLLGPAQSSERRKRVMFGYPTVVSDLDYYTSFRYYVHLSKAQPGWDVIPLEDDLTPEVRHTTCSGVLIAAYIVQTACHCISKESHSREAVAPDGTKLNYIEHFYRAQDVFENPLYSFIGNTLITRLVNWHRPKHYSIHQNCRFLHALPAMYDQGFIILEETVPSRSNLAAISYAPLYRSEEMLRYHRIAIEQELTCLRIGHGLYRITSRDGGEVFNYDPNPSNSLRWGWRTLLNRYDCKYAAIRPEFRLIRYDYDSLSTCDCGQSPQHHLLEQDLRYSSGRGDSGGPIVCGNHLYGTIMGKV
ncbi:hypothetical protein GE061_018229 [Apolygus lucorum]|uniref:Peptidase S1 domain-containing protein n=1 Tax=Apolygus lucorum TaxID=248454 RepID=A0A8S9XD99_APOLU|nr:hypothetical protein GE061_018229 [Apolygus lucorum]